MEPVADLDLINRFELRFTGGQGASIATSSVGFWIFDSAASPRGVSESCLDFVNAWNAVDEMTSGDERANRPTTSIISSGRVTRPIADPEPSAVELAMSLAGTNAGGWLPAEVAMVCSLKSGYAGPAARGRVYWPHLAQGVLSTNGIFTSTAVASLTNTISQFITALAADDYNLAVVSRFHVPVSGGPSVPRATPLWAPVLTNTTNIIPDSQRRRGA